MARHCARLQACVAGPPDSAANRKRSSYSFGGDDDALGIDPHADRAIGEGRRDAVAIALQMDQARRRDALGVFDETVERPGKRHQVPRFFRPGVGDRASLRAVQRLRPQLPAARLQPIV